MSRWRACEFDWNVGGFSRNLTPLSKRSRTPSAASGIAVIDGIPAGAPLIACAPQLGVQRHEYETSPIVVPPGEELEVTLRASRSFTVSGIVTSSAGEPLEEVWVQVCAPTATGMRYYRILQELETDADGRFNGCFHPAEGIEYVSFQARHKQSGELTATNVVLGTDTELQADLTLTPPSSLGG